MIYYWWQWEIVGRKRRGKTGTTQSSKPKEDHWVWNLDLPCSRCGVLEKERCSAEGEDCDIIRVKFTQSLTLKSRSVQRKEKKEMTEREERRRNGGGDWMMQATREPGNWPAATANCQRKSQP